MGNDKSEQNMKSMRYIEGVVNISLDTERCVGCGMCVFVCPHQVFILAEKKAQFIDKDGCMECGACATNCPVDAIQVTPGVGCAALFISKWLKSKNINSNGCC
jgi:ferredoxin